jgi:modification target Cys-rich repeat protein
MTGFIKGIGAFSALLLVSCSGGLGSVAGGGGGAGGISGDCQGGFGASAAAKSLSNFIGAAGEFAAAADDISRTLENACKDMGRELGVSDGEMAASGDTPPVKAACDAVSAKIRAEMSAMREANLTIVVESSPPQCTVSVDAYANCTAECDVNVDPGEATMECEGGEMRGGCSAECTGSCSANASAQCSGSCEGTCEGGCQGTCNGACDGNCSSHDANGQCNGTCSGTCEGTCTANCEGSCSGSCVVEASGSCEGECRGGCSVEFEEPTCTGTVRAPSASADCSADCDARLDAQAECTPGSVVVKVRGNMGEMEDRVGRLRQALTVGMPQVTALKAKLDRLVNSGQVLAQRAQEVPNAVGDLGMSAAACATQSASAVAGAFGSVGVSVDVSVSVSASASASAGK